MAVGKPNSQGTAHLVVFGFGLNPYGEALLFHLEEHGRGVERVTVINKSLNLDGILDKKRADERLVSGPRFYGRGHLRL